MPMISFRVSQEEFKLIMAAAKDSHLKRGTYCRKTILDNIPDRLPRY